MSFRLMLLALLVSATTYVADQIELFSGEALQGTITKSTPSKVLIRVKGVGIRTYHKRQIASAVDAGGAPVPLTIELTSDPLSTANKTMLQQVASLEQVYTDPRQMRLLDEASESDVDELKRLAGDSKSKTRDAAISMLSMAGAPVAVAELVRIATTDPKVKIRFAAANRLMDAHVVRCIGSEKLLDGVKRGLSDKNRNNRFCFAYVAGKLGDTDAVPVLKQHLKNSDHHYGESAVLLLGEMGDPSGVPQLLKILRAKGRETEKVRICEVLGRLKASSAAPTLKKLARSRDINVAKAATDALAAISESG